MARKKYGIFVDNIQVEIYNTWVNVYCGNSVYECLYTMDMLNGRPKYEFETTDAVFWISHKHNKWFLAFNWNKLTHEIIAHECFHATVAILQRKGIPFSNDTEEAYAYLLGFLVNKVTELLNEYIK